MALVGRSAHRGAQRRPAAARRGAAASVHGTARLLRDSVRRRRDVAPRRPGRHRLFDRLVLVGARRRARRVCRRRRPLDPSSARTTTRATCFASSQRIARRSGERVVTDEPGIVFLEIDGLALPVLQRAMRDGHAPTMARWLADGTLQAARVGDRPLVADGRVAGGDPARLERRHPRLPLGREGAAGARDVLVAGGLRGDRAAPRERVGAARGRRREPRQPLLRRSGSRHPHRQPHDEAERSQPGLPRVLRERVQRHAVASSSSSGR